MQGTGKASLTGPPGNDAGRPRPVSLALPAMIISETTLSFLGLGLRPPAISWGVMLQDAQNLQTLGLAPWLLFAAVPVIVVILAFNFLGDGLRDAADPYG